MIKTGPGLPPRNWQDFEDLCLDLWRLKWNDPTAQKHGREGQKQFGVDVVGRPGQGTALTGVQCKLLSQLAGRKLTLEMIEAEAEKAEVFEPPLSSFIIATTALRSGESQRAALDLGNSNQFQFTILVFAWEDIWDDLEQPWAASVLAKYYPDLVLAGGVREDYLQGLYSKLSQVPVLGAKARYGSHDVVPLAAVYTTLEVRPTIDYNDRVIRRYSFGTSAVARAGEESRLVLLGPGGSGKSTFMKYLTLCMASELLGWEEQGLAVINVLESGQAPPAREDLAWSHGAPLPVFVELRRLVTYPGFPAEGEPIHAEILLDYVDETEGKDLGRLIRQALVRKNCVLLVLDGLDETPSARAYRERLRQLITAFSVAYEKCRIVVTSRPYAYSDGWKLDGFSHTHLAPFGTWQIQIFVDAWYRYLSSIGEIGEKEATAGKDDLWRRISSETYLQPLAQRPLMLTMIADLHARNGGRLSGGRASLYEDSVELLLDRWNEFRELRAPKSLAKLLGMKVGELRGALERLAFEVHSQSGVEDSGIADIPDTKLWKALDRARPHDRRVDERQVMDYLHQRSGILVAESPELFRFPHRSFQEYLAACYLSEVQFPDLLVGQVLADPELWREVLLMVIGKISAEPFKAWAAVDALIPEDPPKNVAQEDPRILVSLLVGIAVAENRLMHEAQARDQSKLERIRRWLIATVCAGAFNPSNRAVTGQVLGILGDKRPGVGLSGDGLPAMSWVRVPGGSYTIGPSAGMSNRSGSAKLELSPFLLSRYPVTNLQYKAFLNDISHSDQWRHLWAPGSPVRMGFEDLGDDKYSSTHLLGNYPKVDISWYEATAFCKWLGERLDQNIALPSEAQWEVAARGVDERLYVWGDSKHKSSYLANNGELGGTVAVGLYPEGVGPFGAFDQAGNVWEWCLDSWNIDEERPYKHHEGRLDPVQMDSEEPLRVVRGGSSESSYESLVTTYRGKLHPTKRRRDVGFRCLIVDPKAP